MVIYNTIIIGGGVSGLMAAYKLRGLGQRILVVERGKDVFCRRRDIPTDVANGIGGAGLYSDGKLSLYPSATQLWTLDGIELKKAYDELQDFLKAFSVEIDDFPTIERKSNEKGEDDFRQKHYESKLLSLEQRMGIVYRMALGIGAENLLTETEVIKIKKSDLRYEVDIIRKGHKQIVLAEAIILAGGKHCYNHLRGVMDKISISDTFEKTEIGVRIECENGAFDYYSDKQTDVKLIDKSNVNKELRTFCCCRDGVVLQSESYGLVGYNGSSGEENNTGKTNIGILVQTKGEHAVRLKDEIKNNGKLEGASVSLSDFMNGKELLLSKTVDEDIRKFIQKCFPIMAKTTGRVFFPSIEKMGYYPILSDTLQMANENIWLCGDATGLFRGLMPAFVSGLLVSNCLVKSLLQQEIRMLEKIHVKVSPTSTRKVVFAAQSKQTYYCRNAVCEYIFNQGSVPVNPFRIFGYFLDERVDRKLVRNGNNEMIARSDELWVFGQISDGVLFEIALCRKLGKPVRYFSISPIAKDIRVLRPDELVFEPEVHKHQVKKDDLLNLVQISKGDKEKDIQLSLF